MIEGKNIKLVAFEPENWMYIQAWKSDPYYKYFFRNMPEVLNVQQYQVFPQYMNMNVLMVIEKTGNTIVGMATWDNIKLLAKSCKMGMIINEDSKQTGITKDAFMTFINYLTTSLGFHKVIAEVAKDDEGTLSKVKWGGMIEEAVLKEETFFEGKWIDEVRLYTIDRLFKDRYKRFRNGETSWAEAEKAAAAKQPHTNENSVTYS